MFEVIHEFSVLGTACFMMALATVWYSPMLFGRVWMKETGLTEEIVEKAAPDVWKHMVLTFVSYVVMLGLLSMVVAYAPVLSVEPLMMAGAIALFIASLTVPSVLFEGRSLRYYGVQTGFHVVFIVLGVLMLENWPW